MPRLMRFGSLMPARTAGTQSHNSTQECAASNTLGATLRQCQSFDQNHSDEYVFPHFAMNCGRCSAASSVICAASRQLVWSFHSQHWASRFLAHFFEEARGTLLASTGIGLEPVVSTPRPMIFRASNPRVFFAAASAPRTLFSKPKR